MTDFYDERAEHLQADADRYDDPRWIGTHRHHPDMVPDERDEYDGGYSWQLTPQESAELTAQLVALQRKCGLTDETKEWQ